MSSSTSLSVSVGSVYFYFDKLDFKQAQDIYNNLSKCTRNGDVFNALSEYREYPWYGYFVNGKKNAEAQMSFKYNLGGLTNIVYLGGNFQQTFPKLVTQNLVGKTVSFVYNSGSHPGSRRVVEVETQTNSYIGGKDLMLNRADRKFSINSIEDGLDGIDVCKS